MKKEDKNFGKQPQNRQQIAQSSEMIEQRSNNAVCKINTLGTQTKFLEHIRIFSNSPLSKNAQNRFFFSKCTHSKNTTPTTSRKQSVEFPLKIIEFKLPKDLFSDQNARTPTCHLRALQANVAVLLTV